jgi:hypothetical protein
MKVSQMINIMQKILETQGDLTIIGECADCTTDNMDVWVMTDNDNNETCWIQVATPGSI